MLLPQKLGVQEQLATADSTPTSATSSKQIHPTARGMNPKSEQTSEAGEKSLFLQYKAEITQVSWTTVHLIPK